MGQMDPNNVSGLLKLHLRQNPVLSSTALAVSQDALAEVITQGDRTRVSSHIPQKKYPESNIKAQYSADVSATML